MTRKELAEVMLKGIHAPNVEESDIHYIGRGDGLCYVCALGAALVGYHDGDYLKARAAFRGSKSTRNSVEAAVLADLLNIPVLLALEVEDKHLSGEPIEKIAAWLKEAE